LSKLILLDPELFSPIYSIICRSGGQPIVDSFEFENINPDEYREAL